MNIEAMAQMHVLLIDDEPDIRLIAELSLAEVGGMAVSLASSGEEGLRLALKNPPDVILLDVMMPQMDGITTLATLRRYPTLRAIPVIFLTARVQRNDRADYLRYGACGVIAKPFDPMTLPNDISNLINAALNLG